MSHLAAGRDRGRFDSSFSRILACVLLLGASVSARAQLDDTPDPFVFGDVSDVATGTFVISNEITVSGLESTAAIGAGGSFYSVNGEAFTTAAGTVSNGALVRVRVRSASDPSTARNVRLTIGTAFDVFTVTTGPSDTSPVQFHFNDQTNVPPGSTRSGVVTIDGINVATPVSVSGGDYRINEGAYTRIAGMVNAGDIVRVRQQASFEPLTQANTRLMVGSTIDFFTTTSSDTDVNPDAFELELIKYQDRSTVAESQRVTPIGYDAPSPIKALLGTEYRIGNAGGPGVYGSTAGMLQPGESIQVRHTTTARYDGLRETGLQIGKLVVYFRTRTSRRECAESIRADKTGNAIFPPDAFEIDPPEDVNDNQGLISALYPTLDTTTDAFYPSLPCEPSIGGELPEVMEEPTADELESAAYLEDFEITTGQDILDDLEANPRAAVGTFADFSNPACFVRSPVGSVETPCDDPVFLNSSMPFEGRDIIYVHGLETRHLHDRVFDPTGPASSLWPQDQAAFVNAGGYFRTVAEEYWRPHLIEHLSSTEPVSISTAGWQWTPSDPQPTYVTKANRYLVVAWSSNQTIEYAQHAVLTQIGMAISNGKNVVTPPNYPAGQVRPFCANGCMIIGHSTGPLITSSALGLAGAGFYGTGGVKIASRIIAHVSFEGAISGSRVATLGMSVASLGVPSSATVANVVCPAINLVLRLDCGADLTFVLTSILRDLMPPVSQGIWGPWINASPVPTVTFAGGHPKGTGGVTGVIVPGVDDGVISMNSACGNPSPVFSPFSPPSGFTATSLLKAFEFSQTPDRLVRSGRMLFTQKNLLSLPPAPLYLAATCTPWLSPSGMVMPVQNAYSGAPLLDARRRYANHYSFIASIAEHSYDGGNAKPPNEWPSSFGFPATDLRYYMPFPDPPNDPDWRNLEETRVATDGALFTRKIDGNGTHLAKPVDMEQIVMGRKVKFHMPANIGNCVKQGTFKYYCTRWIWKRTYHLAVKSGQKQSSHYAYEYIGRR